LADRADCFVSEELTARFAGEPQAVHVRCYGITPGDHEWLQAHAGDVEACAAYVDQSEIACALAHPFYNVDAPLTPRHRRRLAELFSIWEVRKEFLRHLRQGNVGAGGEQGCAAASAPPPFVPPATAHGSWRSSSLPPVTAVPSASPVRSPGKPLPAPPEAAEMARSRQYDDPIDDPTLYFNRELSWLDFNQRVLELAEDPDVPLLEQIRFCAIYASNLDEFFMVRVAGLFDQIDAGIDARGPDGLPPGEQIDAIQARVLELDRRLHNCFNGKLRPELEAHGIRIVSLETASEQERREIDSRFHEQVFPALTPLVIGLGRPFPYISNLSLSLGVLLRDPESGTEIIARVKVPKELLGRFLPVGEGGKAFVPLEEAIAANLDALFPGTEVIDHGYFRVTRDADFTISDEADDLLQAVQDEIRRRRFGEVVRLEIASGMNTKLRQQLIDALRLEDREVYDVDGLIDLADLTDVADVPGHAELRFSPWTPVTQPRLQGEDDEPVDIFAAIRQGDIIVHHPYDSFATSVERFVEQAVADPDVLAIKQTVYRTSDDSPLVPSLIRASERGKQAVCMVELKARFDEEANIHWAKSLEEAGVHVVYGIPGLKTHVKAIVVARREGDRVREYVHIGTGNYHPKTARLYTDLGLFTADEEIGADVAEMFNFLTGYGRPAEFRKVLVSPTTMRNSILEEIASTVAAHHAGEQVRIALKMNSLVDASCIRALYEASQAGVWIDLNVRGICCLRPGVPGVSENIRVVSVVGRFLEHSRIYAFQRGEETRVLMGSADLMPRNLDSRVELATPVEDPALRAELLDVLERCFAENANAWELDADGAWTRLAPADGQRRSVQEELRERHAARAAEQLAATAG
jgi:polyphosphate kinase